MPRRSAQLCPRCGSSGTLVLRRIGSSSYHYFQHRSQGSTKFCYLGPAQYSAGSQFNPFQLRGLADPGRILKYLEGIQDNLPVYLDKLDLDQLIPLLEEMLQLAKSYREAKLPTRQAES